MVPGDGAPAARPAEPPAELLVRLRRVSPTHHRFEIVRGASTEAFELETRSTLLHDLVHYAVESEAGLRDSFFGRLARGASYAQLTGAAMAGEILATERIVGALQGAWRQGLDPSRFVAGAIAFHEALGTAIPPWLTVPFVARVASRLRALDGAWRATPFGKPLELRFQA